MSQFFIQTSGGGGGGSGILTLTADDLTSTDPVATNISILGECVEDYQPAGITTAVNPNGSSSFYVRLTNRFCGSIEAPDGVTTNLVEFDLGTDPGAFRFHFELVAIDNIADASIGYTLFSTFRTNGVSATIIQTPFIDADEDASLVGCQLGMASGVGPNQNKVYLQLAVSGSNGLQVEIEGYYVRVLR